MGHSVHFVGSYPADTAEQAMRDMIKSGGEYLSQVSDGETGNRQNWIVDHIDSYRKNDAFVLTKDGHWTSYDDCPEFAIAPGHTLSPKDFNLHYHEDAVASWPTFKALREEYGRPDLKFQVGIPHYLDMSLFTFGLSGGLDPKTLNVYAKATAEQIERIRKEPFGDEVIFQIETPASMSMALFPQNQLPDELHPEALGQSIAHLASLAPEGTEFGVHLCLGDLGNESRGQLPDRKAAVALMNAISDNDVWKTRPLRYIHEPHAAGKNPPIFDKQTYRALRDLRLPQGTRYIAGMVHEAQEIKDQQQVLHWIEEALPLGQTLGIAAACGLGRRSRGDAQLLGDRASSLAAS